MGVPLVKTKLLAYGTGAAFGGMAGAFLASLNPDGERRPVRLLVLDLRARDGDLGGLGSIWGVALGAVVLSVINFYLIPDVFNNVPGKDRAGLRPDRALVRHLRFLLVIMMVLRPEGPAAERRRQIELTEA
jgi:branched-chain amino acid transport system permease protein